MCRTGVGARSSAGADKGPDRRQSNHERTDDQAGRRMPANSDSDGDSPVHAAADTPSKNAATSDTHCNFMRQGGGTSQGSSRVEEERHETSRGSHNRGTIRRKCRKQHRRQLRASLVITSRCPTAQRSSAYTYMGADAVHSNARRHVWHPAGAGA